MRGFPKHLNTNQDFLNLKDDYPDQVRAALQRLLADRMQWLNVGKLAEKETGVEDETHKVVAADTIREKEAEERYQYEYAEDPNAHLFRMGFDVEEIEKLVTSIGG